MSLELQYRELGAAIYVQESDGYARYLYCGKSDNEDACLLLRDVLFESKAMNSTNIGTYAGCDMDNYLTATDGTGWRENLAEEVQSALVNVNFTCYDATNAEYTTLSRDIRLLTELEMNGTTHTEESGAGRLPYLALFRDRSGTSVLVAKSAADVAQIWWLASGNSATQFRYVNTSGNLNNYNAAGAYWLRPVLCVAPATLTSEGTEDGLIYLTPSGTYPDREADVTAIVGSTTDRPKAAVVSVDVDGLSDVVIQVSNNAGDASPVWVDCENGMQVALDNTTKETDEWQVGVRLYGKSQLVSGTFGEPIVIVGTEATV